MLGFKNMINLQFFIQVLVNTTTNRLLCLPIYRTEKFSQTFKDLANI